MPSRQQLETALFNADKAGDVEAATMLATALKNNQFDAPNVQQDSASEFPDLSKPATGVVKTISGEVLSPDRSALQQATEYGLGAIKQSPRQLGLAARDVLEGVGGLVDFIGTPIAAGIEYATGRNPRGMGSYVSNKLDLPVAESPSEKIYSEGKKMLVGGGAILGSAQKAKALLSAGGTAQNVARAIAARPDLQLASAVGSGLAGGYVKEQGGGPLEQVMASLLGGVGAPVALAGTQKILAGAKNVLTKAGESPETTAKINIIIETAAREKGVSFGDIALDVRNQLVKDMREAMKTGDISPDTVRRLVDYRTTGLTPTAGPLSLDPGIITKQKNLAKVGANSQDPRLQQLSQIENQNNQRLTQNLNDLGAGAPHTNVNAGQQIIGALDGRAAWAKREIDALYQRARDTSGRSAKLEPSIFSSKANEALDQAMLGGKLPADVRSNLNKISSGEIPFTVDVAEQFKTSIGVLQRATTDKAERLALGMVRKALDDTPLQRGQELGRESIDAFNKARAVNYKWMRRVEQSPALKAVVDGVDPDKFMQTYIIGGGNDASLSKVARLRNLVGDNPEAMTAIKNNMAQFLKERALSGAADETGRFSASGYNKALKSITEAKLNLFFSRREVAALKALGRVASYEQLQPVGSAVNNSNTASAVISVVLDKIGDSALLRKLPLGAEFVGNPIKSITASITAGKLTKIPATKSKPEFSGYPPVLLPYLLSGSSTE